MLIETKLLRNRHLFLLLTKRSIRRQINNNINNKTNNKKYSNNNKIKVRNNDYFGIFDSNHKEICGIIDKNNDSFDLNDKYSTLLEKRSAKMNEQKYLITSFGKVRLDSNNEIKFHGQYEQQNNVSKFDCIRFQNEFLDKSKSFIKVYIN
jgi:hypothetical protein